MIYKKYKDEYDAKYNNLTQIIILDKFHDNVTMTLKALPGHKNTLVII